MSQRNDRTCRFVRNIPTIPLAKAIERGLWFGFAWPRILAALPLFLDDVHTCMCRLAQVKDRGVVESSFTVREFLAQHVVVRHRCVRCQAADTCVCYRDSIYQSTSSPRPSSTPVSLTRHFFPPEEEDLCVRCTLCHVLIPLSELDGHSQSCHESSVVPKTTKTDTETWTEYEATLGVDSTHVPLGLSFTKHTGSGLAQVSDIVPGGAAAKAKIVPGSIVLTLNRCRVDFDRMVRGFSGGSSSFERPLTFRFRYDDHDHDSSRIRIRIPNIQNPKIQLHVPEPRLVETQVSFEKHHFPLACAFQYPETSGRPTVTRVSGYVADQGVLVGSKVVAMNNRRNFSNQELRNAIDSLESIEESLSLTFQRVEGLMRGWS